MYSFSMACFIEAHAASIVDQVLDRLTDSDIYGEVLQKIPARELKIFLRSIYHDLSDWLLVGDQSKIDVRSIASGMRRAQQCMRFSELVLVLIEAKQCLWESFEEGLLIEKAASDPEVVNAVSRFFNRMIIAAAIGYDSLGQPGDGHPPLHSLGFFKHFKLRDGKKT